MAAVLIDPTTKTTTTTTTTKVRVKGSVFLLTELVVNVRLGPDM
jgi:hypothetical protein